MKRLYQAGIIIALFAALGVGTFSFGGGDPVCGEYEKLELEGQTFDTFNDFMNAAEDAGAEYTESQVKNNFEFEEREDGLYYRSLNCEVEPNNE